MVKKNVQKNIWVSEKEVFAKVAKTKEFKEAYRQETVRLFLARQIRETRIEMKLTQKTIAERAGMPQSVIARIEGGASGTSLDTLARVAMALGKQVQLV